MEKKRRIKPLFFWLITFAIIIVLAWVLGQIFAPSLMKALFL